MAEADPPREQLVTSSDLVRRFGMWQERAQRAPVYILHHGQPRFVLASIALIDALCAPHGNGDTAELAAILDGTGERIVLASPSGAVTRASRAAQGAFGARVAPGAPLADLAAPPARAILADAIARTVATGIADRLDVPSDAHPARHLALTLAPYPGGVAAFAPDAGAAAELRAAQTDALALAEAAAAAGAVSARINLRGYLDTPGPALAALTGLAEDALASVRFVTLIEIAGRVVVADAIEAVIADGAPRGLGATLLVNRDAPRPVRIGLAAHRAGAAIDGVTALIVPAATG